MTGTYNIDVFDTVEHAYAFLQETRPKLTIIATGEALLGYYVLPHKAYLLLATHVVRTMLLPPFHSVYTVLSAKWIAIDLPYCILHPTSVKDIQNIDQHSIQEYLKSDPSSYSIASTFALEEFKSLCHVL